MDKRNETDLLLRFFFLPFPFFYTIKHFSLDWHKVVERKNWTRTRCDKEHHSTKSEVFDFSLLSIVCIRRLFHFLRSFCLLQ